MKLENLIGRRCGKDPCGILHHASFSLQKVYDAMLIPFPLCLRHPEVWRFVGFVSTIVGLFSYALSSSFNHLFGEWNLLKIFLYTFFSFIIGLMTLFAKLWRNSAFSLLFKAHMAILVLMATSVYSFFYDQAVKGKPDGYILISCAAFAVMSLSLSRQTHCGIEIDLLYFFLGCLIVQLMKISLLLVIVGGCFSYSLVILRASLDASVENGYIGPQVQNQVVIQEDSPQINQHQVVVQVDSYSQQDNIDSDSAILITHFMSCLEALKKKNMNLVHVLFRHLKVYLKVNSGSKDKNQPLMMDHNLIMDTLPPGIINNLCETVKLMVANGFEEECCHLYSNCRREFLEECLWKLGLQKLSIEDIENKVSIEFRIWKWIKASNVTLRVLLPNERRLCDSIFFRFSAADRSFEEVCRGLLSHLLNFAGAFPITRSSPNLMCSNLKVLETLHDMIEELESNFSYQYSEAITISKKFGEAIRGVFRELENQICHDPKPGAPSGGLHRVTRYVMNYLRAACRSRQTLEHVFEDCGKRLKEYSKFDDIIPSSLSLSEQMHSIMELLESNLEAKSKIYKDPALCYVFLMNNSGYMVEKAKDSELGTLLGNDWIQKHAAKVQQYQICYQRNAWKKVLRLLKQEGNSLVAPNDAGKSMRDKLKLFDMKFEEIYRVQSLWYVFDEQLREEIRISLEKMLVPAYENFIVRFQNVLGKQANKYIKYEIKDIEARLKDLLQGSKGATGGQKRRESEMFDITVGEKEPTAGVQRISDMDIIDDGYKWTTYRCRVKKGNANPSRRCYRCVWLRCPVRKQVERASHDPRTLITTYSGIHNHGKAVAPSSDSHFVNKALPNNATNTSNATTAWGPRL